MKYEVIGYERVQGEKSRKSGKPYDLRIFHCKDLTPFTKSADFGGNKVEQINVWLYNQDIDYVQRVLDIDVGDIIKVYYDRNGFISNVEVVIA